jgi:tyrosyl-tRNA synthetase
MGTPAERAAFFTDGCDHVETRRELEERLSSGRPLRVKLGLDPTSPDLHIGHAVVLRKMQQFVAAGHDVTLVIGSMTARIGDPSGRNQLRPALSDDEIQANMRTYAEQAGKVLDLERVHLRYNAEWLAPLRFEDIIRLLAQTTVARMLDRNDFAERYAANTPISLHEFLYPVAQAYDSVALQSDVELGGNDQLFNLLMGRAYQEHAGQPPQICMTTPLLEGLDGKVKMSKSVGNHIGLTEPPEEQFGKMMRIPDELIVRYARLAVGRSQSECDALAQALAEGRAAPMDEKKRLAEELVALYHGADATRAARQRFERTVQHRELPEEMPELEVGDARRLSDVLLRAGFAQSRREAERLVLGGGVRVDGVPVHDAAMTWTATEPVVVSLGSRRFVRVLPAAGVSPDGR